MRAAWQLARLLFHFWFGEGDNGTGLELREAVSRACFGVITGC
jgi:hypothetical protein